MGKVSKGFEALQTYEFVPGFLLQISAADEVISEACIDVVNYCQSSAVTRKTYSQILQNRPRRFGVVFFSRRLKSLLMEGLFSRTPTRTARCLSLSPQSYYCTQFRQAQALGDSSRAARRPAAMALAIVAGRKTVVYFAARTLSVDSSSAESESDRRELAGSEILTLADL